MENYTDHNTDPTIEPIRRLIETMGATAVGLSPESDDLQEEQRLVEKVVQGNDAEALALLYDDYRRYLLAVVWGVTITRSDPWLMKNAEDYLQSTYEKAFVNIDSFTAGDHPKAVRGWLAQILRRTVLDEMKNWSVSHTITIDTEAEQIKQSEYMFMHDPLDPFEIAALSEEVAEVVTILNEVLGQTRADRERNALIMKMAFFEESTPNEIAEELGLSVGVIKGVLQRARQAVRKKLGGRDQ
jgi:RNA polymerase sigma factor (sigma-70 family)